MTRMRKCNQPTCGVSTKHRLAFSDDGMRRVWECENCGHQKPVRTLGMREVNATPGFAIQIKDDTELGLAVLIAEFGDSSYEPIAVVATVSEAREIAAGDLRTRMQEMEMGCEDVQPPESYTLWAAGLAGVYHPIKISLAEL